MPFSTATAPLRPVPGARVELRAPRVSSQVLRFLVVGGIATVVLFALFNLLHYALGVGPLTSKALATVAAGVVAFLGNREFTFGDQRGTSARAQAVAFVLVSVVALGIELLPLALTRYGLGLTSPLALNLSGNVVGLALGTAFRFYGCRRWVFRTPAPVPVPAVAAVADEQRLAA